MAVIEGGGECGLDGFRTLCRTATTKKRRNSLAVAQSNDAKKGV